MPSIAMFFSSHTFEQEIKEKLVAKSDFTLVDDSDIIHDASKLFFNPNEKLQKALYQKTSVFNKFTLERELNTSYLKAALANRLLNSGQLIYGFTSHLIPKNITHILKVLVVDERGKRVTRATASGMTESSAEKEIRLSDISAYHWTDFLLDAEPWDARLYDVVIPVKDQQPEEIVDFILKQCSQASLLETRESAQAVKDLQLNADVEINLLRRGQNTTVQSKKGDVLVQVNKSVLNFNALSQELSDQVAEVDGVKSVKVVMGKDYNDSIYRDQEFKRPPKVLLVDDEKEFATTLSERLINRNVGTHAVYDGQEALDFLVDDAPDVMVLDLKMPGISGIEVLEQTKKKNPNVEVIILTGHGTEEDKQNCLDLGAFAYLQKPTDIHTLSEAIQEAHHKGITR